jgi:MYXO-CTERM domain-containing protein
VTTETIVTTAPPVSTAPIATPDLSLPPMEGTENPYANSYNELLPLPVTQVEDDGFDDWGLLGLPGLLGLLGLRRRPERVVYVERDTTVHRVREDGLPPHH